MKKLFIFITLTCALSLVLAQEKQDKPLDNMHCFVDVGIVEHSFPVDTSEGVRVYYDGNMLTLEQAVISGLIEAPKVIGDDGVNRWRVKPIQNVCVGRLISKE